MIKKTLLYFLFFGAAFSCNDVVKKYDGFTQREMEFLLASYGGKIWQRVSRTEDGQEITPDDCGLENYMIFTANTQQPVVVGSPKPLFYAYNPVNCDSLAFCASFPEYCLANKAFCEANPDVCNDLQEGILNIGTWFAKAPFIQNSRTDTLVFEINSKREAVFVTDITSEYATFLYKNRTTESGGEIRETYQFLSDDAQ